MEVDSYNNYGTDEKRPYIAVASQEGIFINLHLGESEYLRIYQPDRKHPKLVDIRTMPDKYGHGTSRWKDIAERLNDCSCLLVSGIGSGPRAILQNNGIAIFVVEGLIDKALIYIAEGKGLECMTEEYQSQSGAGCTENDAAYQGE